MNNKFIFCMTAFIVLRAHSPCELLAAAVVKLHIIIVNVFVYHKYR